VQLLPVSMSMFACLSFFAFPFLLFLSPPFSFPFVCDEDWASSPSFPSSLAAFPSMVKKCQPDTKLFSKTKKRLNLSKLGKVQTFLFVACPVASMHIQTTPAACSTYYSSLFPFSKDNLPREKELRKNRNAKYYMKKREQILLKKKVRLHRVRLAEAARVHEVLHMSLELQKNSIYVSSFLEP